MSTARYPRPCEDRPASRSRSVNDQRVLAYCYAAAGGLALNGDRAGSRLLRIVDPLRSRPDEPVGELGGSTSTLPSPSVRVIAPASNDSAVTASDPPLPTTVLKCSRAEGSFI